MVLLKPAPQAFPIRLQMLEKPASWYLTKA